MPRCFTRFVLACALLCGAVWALAQMPGTITAVTVHRGQALVTRHVTAALPAGDQEVVVTQLPERIQPTSLYATAGGNLTIRSVRYRARAVTEDPRDEVAKTDAAIEAAQSTLRRIAMDATLLASQTQYLDKLANFVTPTASTELSKGVLNPDALVKTSDYIFTQRSDIAKKQLALDEEKLKVQKQLDVLQRTRAELVAGCNKTLREAVVLLTQDAAGQAEFDLCYLVDGADWSPAYAADLHGDHSKLELAYHAVVTQVSGEDWKDVKLTLSTSRPMMRAEMPAIAPMLVALAPTGNTPAYGDARQYLGARSSLDRQAKNGEGLPLSVASENGGWAAGDANIPAMNAPQSDMFSRNLLAARGQGLELAVSDEAVKTLSKAPTNTMDVLAVSYALPGKASLASRNNPQMFRIATLALESSFYYTVVPLITNYVYQGVEARNTSALALLPGPYNAYLDGQFAGSGTLPLVAANQSFAIGFGTETQLRGIRELTDKTTEIRGGNKLVKYTYKLTLRNYMNRPARLRVWDRIPQAIDTNVMVKLIKPERELSTDAFYVNEEQPTGLLRWDVDVPALAVDAKSVIVTYSFTMEYDKNFAVAEPSAAVTKQMEEKFRMLQFDRDMNYNSSK